MLSTRNPELFPTPFFTRRAESVYIVHAELISLGHKTSEAVIEPNEHGMVSEWKGTVSRLVY